MVSSSSFLTIIPYFAFLLHIVSAAWNVTAGCQSPCNDIYNDSILAGTWITLQSTGIPDGIQGYSVHLQWGPSEANHRDSMQVLAVRQTIAADRSASIMVPTPPNTPAGNHYYILLASSDHQTRTYIGPLRFQERAPVYTPPRRENFTVELGCYATKCHDNNTVYMGDTLLVKWTNLPEDSPNMDRYSITLCWGLDKEISRRWIGCLSLKRGIIASDTPIELAPSGVNVTITNGVAPGSSYYLTVTYYDGTSQGPSASAGPFTIASSG
ncbi:hypothetical protein K492DRAFT_182603 [Lichtheimia hyalospora FSU 10163]|nr:hypothetical protein K492DRAFT_182603 [Lichtheimia hyalospora FSU 10163]